MRDPGLAVGEVYHIYTKSIAGFKVFNTPAEFERMRIALRHYQPVKAPGRLSYLMSLCPSQTEPLAPRRCNTYAVEPVAGDRLIQLIAYCFMQTHFHLLVRQLEPDGISVFMNRILNSYSRYFNLRHRRKGPLWESRFQDRHIKTTEDALCMTRYIHLNPVTAGLVKKAGDWEYSSYAEYMGKIPAAHCLCDFRTIFDLPPRQYEKFVADHAAHQQELARLKKSLLDDPSIA